MTQTLAAVSLSIQNLDANSLFKGNGRRRDSLLPSGAKSGSLFLYENLSPSRRNALRMACIAKSVNTSFFMRLLFCSSKNEATVAEEQLSPTFFKMAAYIGEHGLLTEGIFRREGDRSTYQSLTRRILIADKTRFGEPIEFDFSEYSMLELASAYKYYIREVLDGLFDYRIIERALNAIAARDPERSYWACRYVMFSMNESQREFFISLKQLLFRIVEHKETNKMTWDSICNIFSLTICPLQAFTSIHSIPLVQNFFRIITEMDLNDISGIEF